MRNIEFKVVKINLAKYCMIASNTEIFCEGEPMKRKDKERLDDIGYNDVGRVRKQIAHIYKLVELSLRYLQLFKTIGVKPSKEILRYKPFKTGKTLIAHVVANEISAFLL